MSISSCSFLHDAAKVSEVAYSKYQSLFFILLLNFSGFFSRSRWNFTQIAASCIIIHWGRKSTLNNQFTAYFHVKVLNQIVLILYIFDFVSFWMRTDHTNTEVVVDDVVRQFIDVRHRRITFNSSTSCCAGTPRHLDMPSVQHHHTRFVHLLLKQNMLKSIFWRKQEQMIYYWIK